MAYLIFILLALALFAGFLILTKLEASRGSRYFAKERATLDEKTAQVTFVLAHVDFLTYLRDLLRAVAARVIHDVVHGSLLLVRFLERTLTHAVRTLRTRHAHTNGTPSPSSTFVAQMKDFKEELRENRKVEETVGDSIENRD